MTKRLQELKVLQLKRQSGVELRSAIVVKMPSGRIAVIDSFAKCHWVEAPTLTNKATTKDKP